MVDERLDWSEHTKSVKAKLSSSLYAINASKHYLTTGHLLMLYNALVYPYLTYGLLLWGSTFRSHLNKLIVMQKRAVRTIVLAPYNSHTHDIFLRLNILKLDAIYQLYLAKYMYLQLHDLLPDPLLKAHRLCGDIHTHYTRQTKQLHKKMTQSAIVAKSFIKRGPDYWNQLPEDIKRCATLKSFNTRHKIYLLRN